MASPQLRCAFALKCGFAAHISYFLFQSESTLNVISSFLQNQILILKELCEVAMRSACLEVPIRGENHIGSWEMLRLRELQR